MDGVINVLKPAGMTSMDVVARVRRLTSTKKAGHTGTLDPDVTGVLPVFLGNYTKAIHYLENEDKAYHAECIFGLETDTQDASGAILSREGCSCDINTIRTAIEAFVGSYDQLPPMYSAKKVNGKRLYDLARQGLDIERNTKRVTIKSINITKIVPDELDGVRIVRATFDVRCSRGTYIRTLCADIGNSPLLHCGAYMSSLVRTASGRFDIETAVDFETIEKHASNNDLSSILTPLTDVLQDFPPIRMGNRELRHFLNGVKLSRPSPQLKRELENSLKRFDGENLTSFYSAVYNENGELVAVASVAHNVNDLEWELHADRQFNTMKTLETAPATTSATCPSKRSCFVETPDEIPQADIKKGMVVTLGAFDGMHIGHMKLVEQTQTIAKERGLSSLMFTFVPRGEILQTRTDRAAFLQKRTHLDYVLERKFDTEFAALAPESFVREYLVSKLNCKCIVIGYNNTFGAHAGGDADLMQKLGVKYGFDVYVQPEVKIELSAEQQAMQEIEQQTEQQTQQQMRHQESPIIQSVSTTSIKQALAEGNLTLARTLLGGHNITISGTVERGKMLGRTLGYPTANIYPTAGTFLPANGVYAIRATLENGRTYFGITNIGTNPTVSKLENDFEKKTGFCLPRYKVETCLDEYSGDLYGKKLRIELIAFLRPERKMSSLSELIERIDKDMENMRNMKQTVMEKNSCG